MPKISEIKASDYLTKDDVGRGVLVTIANCVEEPVGHDKELLWCLHFRETEKKMVLKTTNATLIQSFLGGDHTDQWIGKQIVLFNDPTVMMGGRAVGGIRVRAPKLAGSPPAQQPAGLKAAAPVNPPPAQVPAELPQMPPEDDDVPF